MLCLVRVHIRSQQTPSFSHRISNPKTHSNNHLVENLIEDKIEEKNPLHLRTLLRLHPSKKTQIFGALLTHQRDNVSKTDIRYFQQEGIDINKPSNRYQSDAGGTTPLGFACEFRLLKLIKALIECGADVNQRDQHGFSPLESLLTGHSYYYMEDIETTEKGIKLLLQAGVKRCLQKYILDEFCEEYWKSPFLKKFLTSCVICKDR